jgi:hypothetical protein
MFYVISENIRCDVLKFFTSKLNTQKKNLIAHEYCTSSRHAESRTKKRTCRASLTRLVSVSKRDSSSQTHPTSAHTDGGVQSPVAALQLPTSKGCLLHCVGARFLTDREHNDERLREGISVKN